EGAVGEGGDDLLADEFRLVTDVGHRRRCRFGVGGARADGYGGDQRYQNRGELAHAHARIPIFMRSSLTKSTPARKAPLDAGVDVMWSIGQLRHRNPTESVCDLV